MPASFSLAYTLWVAISNVVLPTDAIPNILFTEIDIYYKHFLP